MDRGGTLHISYMRSVFIVCCWIQLCTSSLKHFRGGSTSFDYILFDGSFHKVKITAVTGWDLGDSPCGPHCSEADVGKSTRAPRDDIIRTTGSETHFGEWQLEIMGHDGKRVERNITTEVNSKIEGRVAFVSELKPQWVQEVASFDLELEHCRYVDVIFTGSAWIDLQMQDCAIADCRYYIQQKIKFGVRNDTGTPNNSPRVLYQAVNRIKPNQVSQIPIYVTDGDGDKCECRKAGFKLITFLQIRGLSVTKDCIVTVDSTTFPEGSWGMVNIVVEDKPRTDIVMGGILYPANSSSVLSQIQVQFLVQVARAFPPSIVPPTACVNNTGNTKPTVAYIGESLSIPVYTTPNPGAPAGTEIVNLKVTYLPTPAMPLVVVNSTIKSTGKDRRFDLVWEKVPALTSGEASQYLLQVFAADNQGYDSEACSFQIEITERDENDCYCKNDGLCHKTTSPFGEPELKCFCPLGFSGVDCSSGDTDPKPKKPTFDDIAGIPNGGLIQCLEFSHCTFAIHTIGREPGQPPLLTNAPKSPELKVHIGVTMNETSTSLAGNRFVTSVMISTGPTGLYKFCVNAVDTSRMSRISATYCYHVRVVSDPSGGRPVNETGFVPPTAPNGSEIPCLAHTQGCNLLMYTDVLHTGSCPDVKSVDDKTALVIVTSVMPDNASLCVSQVLLFSTGGRSCIQIDSTTNSVKGETRCYTVKPTERSASLWCRISGCNKALGACLATPDKELTQCVCPEELLDQLDEKCFPLPTTMTPLTPKVTVAAIKPKDSVCTCGVKTSRGGGSFNISTALAITPSPSIGDTGTSVKHDLTSTSGIFNAPTLHKGGSGLSTATITDSNLLATINPTASSVTKDTSAGPGKSLIHRVHPITTSSKMNHRGTTVDPRKRLGPSGTDTTVAPRKPLGPSSSNTTAIPGKLLSGGSVTTVALGKSPGPRGPIASPTSVASGRSKATANPRNVLGRDGKDTTADLGKPLSPGHSATTFDPRKQRGPGGSVATISSGKPLFSGGSDATIAPGKSLGPGGSITTVAPRRSLGSGGSDATAAPGKLSSSSGLDSTVNPGKVSNHITTNPPLDPKQQSTLTNPTTVTDMPVPVTTKRMSVIGKVKFSFHIKTSSTEITTQSISTSETAAHDVSTTETTTSGISTSETATHDVSTTEKTTNGISTSETATHDVSTTETTTSGISTSETATHDVSTTEKTTNGISTSETATHDVSTTETTTNGISTSETATHDVSTTETTTGGISTSETATHDVSTTETTTGGISTSKTATHDVSTTETTTGGISTSEIATHDVSTSKSSGSLVTNGPSGTINSGDSVISGGSITTMKPRQPAVKDKTITAATKLSVSLSSRQPSFAVTLGLRGSHTTVDPGKPLGPGGSHTTLDPGKLLGPGGSRLTVDPGKPLGPGGSHTTVDPGKLLGPGGSRTTVDPGKPLGPGGSHTAVDPGKPLGPGGSHTTVDPGKPLGPGGSHTTVDPGKPLGPGGSHTTVGPGKPLGPGGSHTTVDPGKPLGPGGSHTTVDPGKSSDPGGSRKSISPGKPLGVGGSDTTITPGKPSSPGASDSKVSPRKPLGSSGSNTTVVNLTKPYYPKDDADDSVDTKKRDKGFGPGYNNAGSESQKQSCLTAGAWRKAFEESKVKCTCEDTLTGRKRVVIRPRVSTERLLRAFLIGLGVSSSALVTAVLIYCHFSKEKSY